MTLYYFDDCQQEFDVINQFLKWQNINVTCKNSMDMLKFTSGKAQPVLIDNSNNVLGVGFFGILKYLSGKGLFLI